METIEKEDRISMTQTAGHGLSTTTNIMQQKQLVQKRSPQIPILITAKLVL